MGMLLGIAGEQNTGKSHSRTTMRNGEECFIIMPSPKAAYLTKKDGKNIEPLRINKPGLTMSESLRLWNGTELIKIIDKMVAYRSSPPNMEVSGNYYIVNDIVEAEVIVKFVSEFMPHIKVVIFPDFTHFVTDKLTSPLFRNRNTGNDAYGRYVDLAADTFNAFFKSAKQTRDDLVQVIEFHVEFNEIAKSYKIFTPGGKMLSEKFKPESYFDVFLYSHYIDEDTSPNMDFKDRFRFITRKWKHFDARCMGGMFDTTTELMIPNDLQLVIDRLRKYQGIAA